MNRFLSCQLCLSYREKNTCVSYVAMGKKGLGRYHTDNCRGKKKTAEFKDHPNNPNRPNHEPNIEKGVNPPNPNSISKNQIC